jgi:hypothetical protein
MRWSNQQAFISQSALRVQSIGMLRSPSLLQPSPPTVAVRSPSLLPPLLPTAMLLVLRSVLVVTVNSMFQWVLGKDQGGWCVCLLQ